jgi:L-glyceraldehyde 3-phosphate reductase
MSNQSNPYTPAEDRYQTTPKAWFRRCGRSGLMLPAISLGCWHNFGGVGTDSGKHADEASFHENCRRMLFAAFDQGITHFDLANNYGPPGGSAEERVGRIINDDFKAHRDELIIATKAGYYMWPGPYGDLGSRKYLLSSLDQSLKRLRVDYVDIFYHHRPDLNTPLEESLGALDQAVKSGKAIYAGISNYRGGLTAEAVGVCRENGFAKPVIHQPNYNMFDRWIENDLLPVTERAGLGTIVFSPMAQGMLSDKYLNGIPEQSRATAIGGFLRPAHISEAKIAKAKKLNDLAKQRGQTLAQLALVWTLRKPAVTSALIGASRPEQIKENVAALNNAAFSEDELKQIETILAS